MAHNGAGWAPVTEAGYTTAALACTAILALALMASLLFARARG